MSSIFVLITLCFNFVWICSWSQTSKYYGNCSWSYSDPEMGTYFFNLSPLNGSILHGSKGGYTYYFTPCGNYLNYSSPDRTDKCMIDVYGGNEAKQILGNFRPNEEIAYYLKGGDNSGIYFQWTDGEPLICTVNNIIVPQITYTEIDIECAPNVEWSFYKVDGNPGSECPNKYRIQWRSKYGCGKKINRTQIP